MRLELGAGDRPTSGFRTLDIRDDVGADIVGDATNPDTWGVTEPIEEIRATHLLEHFSWRDTPHILKAWRAALAPGGRLYLEVPNLYGHFAQWRKRQNDAELVEYLYGRQDYPENFHKQGFTRGLLQMALINAGFVGVTVDDIGLVLIGEAKRP